VGVAGALVYAVIEGVRRSRMAVGG
jgi:hypothetical protein